MMSDRYSRAEKYRVRAEEVRAIAETMRHPDTRDMLLEIAADYENMAAQIERIGEVPAFFPDAESVPPSVG